MKIAFFSAEAAPFATSGGLGYVSGTLPLALEKKGMEVILVMPLFKCIDKTKFSLKPLKNGVWTTTIGRAVKVYFIENDAYFGRDGLYGTKEGDYPDNCDRFSFYCRRSFDVLKQVNFKADILHCHDWHTALIPAFLKFLHQDDPFFKKAKSILTIHNLAYQGVFPKWDFLSLGLKEELFGINGFEFYDEMNLLKGGIIFSDCVTTVSPNYAQEIQTPYLGCGLEGVLRKRQAGVSGILNGIDYDIWNPKKDRLIAKTYDADSIDKKAANKRKLQDDFDLKVRDDVPLFGFVGRLSSQKGFDLIAEAIQEIMRMDLQMVFLGSGDQKYEELLRGIKKRYPHQIGIDFEYNEKFAHEIYAGADIFLMPSHYEPCGLSQMISLRYGTIPLVYNTGGLADTITPFNSPKRKGNGFVFDRYTKDGLVSAVKLATMTYANRKLFGGLVKRSFEFDFSWDKSAKEYEKLYKKCLRSA